MKKPFKRLDDDQQYHILTTAMAEFSKHGYKQASTNRIVKAAGISKGMLYYYFDSKHSLYLSAARYAYDHFTINLLDQVRLEEEGFIERLARLSRVKHKYFMQHPEISQFVTHMFYATELLEDYQQALETLRKSNLDAMYEKVDMELFRSDIDRETMMKMIRWTFDGYIREMEQHFEAEGIDFGQIDAYFDRFESYLGTMRTLYYKEAGQ
ncbi:TetR/AcrR family transcriptional regulator [Salinicoccus luteus]|uniref:TetR/AcrR family transcriptional regulator n=1 Tax=Salinicoccus luteus TaxID=367840 RepID=UPI0004E27996|nr:TetR/AcrR family transcriptional regulator [Salinicoccus luteus]